MSPIIALLTVDALVGLAVGRCGLCLTRLGKEVVATDERAGARFAVVLRPTSRVTIETRQAALAVVSHCVVLAVLVGKHIK
jgi:hypothetical protein